MGVKIVTQLEHDQLPSLPLGDTLPPRNACFQRAPGPEPGVRVQIHSSARPGSCSTSHALTAIAWRLSRLE